MAAYDGGSFWEEAPEKGELNQYWFSKPTIQLLVDQVINHGPSAALVSCPSIYFSLPCEARECCKVLEFDTVWKDDPGFVFYDFNKPEEIPPDIHNTFDLVIIDPPFITRKVWSLYAISARLLAKKGTDDQGLPLGRLLCTSIPENAPMMWELLEVEPRRFRPSIPNLVYQYHVYANYSSPALMQHNPEIDPDGVVPMPEQKPTAAWESTYGSASGRADEIVVGTQERDMVLPSAWGDEACASKEEETIDFGPACNAAILRREKLGELKKAIDGLGALVEAVAQYSARVAKAPEEKKEVVQNALLKAIGFRDESLAALVEVAASIDRTSSVEEASYNSIAETICVAARQDMATKKDVFAFTSGAKRHSQQIFKQQTALLAQIKQLKKEHSSVAASSGSPSGELDGGYPG